LRDGSQAGPPSLYVTAYRLDLVTAGTSQQVAVDARHDG
jgi:hypothetical protein